MCALRKFPFVGHSPLGIGVVRRRYGMFRIQVKRGRQDGESGTEPITSLAKRRESRREERMLDQKMRIIIILIMEDRHYGFHKAPANQERQRQA
jgi:hypothetical protein